MLDYKANGLPIYSFTQFGNNIICESYNDIYGEYISLSSDGTIIAIASRQYNPTILFYVQVYEFNGSTWNQIGTNIYSDIVSNNSGYSMSLSNDGNTIVFGFWNIDINIGNFGIVRVYNYDGNNWIQLGDNINGEIPDDLFGCSVSLSNDGNIIAIGAWQNDGNGIDSGSVRVFKYDNDNWIQIGNEIYGEHPYDTSGWPISLSGDGTIIAIGANYNSDTFAYSGHVRIYKYYDNNWIQLGNDIDGKATNDLFGTFISLSNDGNIIAIGTQNNGDVISIELQSNNINSNNIYIYKYDGNDWIQLGNNLNTDISNYYYGSNISLSGNGNIIAIGSPYNNNNGINSGNVKLFKYNGSEWLQICSTINGNDNNFRTGYTVTLSSNGETLAVTTLSDNNLKGSVSIYKINQDGIYNIFNTTQPVDNLIDGLSYFNTITNTVNTYYNNIWYDAKGYTGPSGNNGMTGPKGDTTISYNLDNKADGLPIYSFTQLGTNINGEFDFDLFGKCVSLSSNGSIIAIGTTKNNIGSNSGNIYIYSFDGSNWNQLGNCIYSEAENNESGNSISLSSDGSIIAIGSYLNNNTGSVRVYNYNGTEWIKLGSNINSNMTDDRFGISVSLSSDGTIVAIGADYNSYNGLNSGNVSIFKYDNNNWVQLGNNISGETEDDYSGKSISLSNDGTIIAIGSYRNNSNGFNTGNVRIFKYNGSNWIKLGNNIYGEIDNDYFGTSISLSGDGSVIAIGANGNMSGYTQIYKFNDTTWIQLGNDIVGGSISDNSGKYVKLSNDGTTVAIGANDGNGINSGNVRLFKYNGTNWFQIGNSIYGENGYMIGESISLSYDGSIMAIGTPNENSKGFVSIYKINQNGICNIFNTIQPINNLINGLSYLDTNNNTLKIYCNGSWRNLSLTL